MKVDISVPEGADAAEAAAGLDTGGPDRLWLGETGHDVFLQSLRALQATSRLEVGTSIAVAFARNPMNTAYVANDLSCWSGGRFSLGLGTQIKAHIERRFGMPWSRPAARMEEYVRALRAIWHSWRTGERLEFRGEFYQHTLMTPMFTPPRIAATDPEIFLAAVGPRMTEVAGRVADGIITHAFSTERYLREVTVPRFAAAARAAGRPPGAGQLSASVFVVAGDRGIDLADLRQQTRARLAFYGSTPAYRDVLAVHGWGDLADELTRLSRGDATDRWATMAALVDDTVLSTFAVCADTVPEAAREVGARFGELADRVTLCVASAGAGHLPRLVAGELQAATG